MSLDLQRMRDACVQHRWTVDDIDWEGEGCESPETAAALQGFLTDVVWVEYVAEPIFEAMAKNTDDPLLAEIYGHFGADERRHAEAEMQIMRRWGLLDTGEMPAPNVNIRQLHRELSVHSASLHPTILAAIIPMLELLLDGALVRFLLEATSDPVVHRAFARINKDESRHLAIDFHVLESSGRDERLLEQARYITAATTNRHILWALFFGLMPYLARARFNLEAMGLDYAKVERMLRRYVDLGDSNREIAKNPCYRVVRLYAAKLARGDFVLEGMLARLSDVVAGLPLTSRFF